MTDRARAARAEYRRRQRAKETPEQREKRLAYLRAWRKEHPERQQIYIERFWERIAARMQDETGSK